MIATECRSPLRKVINSAVGGSPGCPHRCLVAPGAEITLPWREDFNGLAYVLAGRGSVGAERRPIHLGQTAVFGAGGSLKVRGL